MVEVGRVWGFEDERQENNRRKDSDRDFVGLGSLVDGTVFAFTWEGVGSVEACVAVAVVWPTYGSQ